MISVIRLFVCFLLLNLSLQTMAKNIIITGTIVEVSDAVFLSNKSKLTPLKLENNRFEITIQKGSFPEDIAFVTLSGSKIVKITPKIWLDTDSIHLSIDVNKDKPIYKIDYKYKYQDVSECIELETNKKKQMQLIKENISTYPALFFLYEYHEKWDPKTIETVLGLVPKHFHSTVLYQRIKAYLEACQLPKPKKGKIFKPFSVISRSGKSINIESSYDKYRLFVFVSSGCYYSLASLTELSNIHKQYKDKLDIVTIWQDKDRDTWLNYETDLKKNIEWTDVWDQTQFVSEYFRISIYPSFYLVDKDGMIVKVIKGFSSKKLHNAIYSLK